jgi:hypothetical protein
MMEKMLYVNIAGLNVNFGLGHAFVSVLLAFFFLTNSINLDLSFMYNEG